MIAVRMLPRQEYRERLRPYGCQMMVEAEIMDDGIYGWAYWRTAWGFFFIVPEIGPDNACPEDRFLEILAEIARQTPDP